MLTLAAGVSLGVGRMANAAALPAPAGPVLLTVTGKLQATTDGRAASFDLEMLQALPHTSFSTKTPWYREPRRFDGVLVVDLLTALGASPEAGVKAAALNDYRVDLPAEDLIRHRAMLAYWLDGKPMSVREKGPLVIVFPFDDRPELRNALHYSRAIWQLCSLEVP